MYADSSALVKLVVDEPESPALESYLGAEPLTTSALAMVEVSRAAEIASPGLQTRARVDQILAGCRFIDVGEALLRVAAQLASFELRTLDAIHLASAQLAVPDEVITYDRRLRRAVELAGFLVASPGA